MSWNPFNKLIAPKKGFKGGEDGELEFLSNQLSQIEVGSKRIYKDMKRYLESHQNLAKANQKLFQDLSNALSSISAEVEFIENTERMEALSLTLFELAKELSLNVQTTFIEPMKTFQETIPTVYSAMKRREQSLQDYSKYLARKEKYQEKDTDAKQSGKFDANEKYLGAARFDFEKRNRQLLEDLPQLFNCRKDYFLPCLDGFVRSQYLYYQNSSNLFEQVGMIFDQYSLVDDAFVGDDTKELQATLNDIMGLSIVRVKQL